MKRFFIFFGLMIAANTIFAQSSYIIEGGKEDQLLTRMEIKMRTPYLLSSANKPYLRSKAVKELQDADSLTGYFNADAETITDIDIYNIRRFLMANSEFSKPRPYFISNKPVFKTLYKNKANAVEVRTSDFVLIANPILQYKQIKEKDNDEKLFQNSRGLTARGIIANKVGFNFYFTENQERLPVYMQQRINNFQAVPGVGFYKAFKTTGVDYFDIRSSVSFKAASFMDVQLGYDKNFIGDGYRSLFLSDYANNAMFIKLQTHYRQFNYQSLFMELTGQHPNISNFIYPRKYARISHLTYQPKKWLTIGLFEGLIINKSTVPVKLFNPLMFTNFNKDEDKSYGGADIKMNLAHKLQLYSQFMADNINFKNNDSYSNRFGYQAGLKYIDVLGLGNVDLQLETNTVRPFTYASNNTNTSYSHYNLPLAHPLGSNFNEYIAILKAQPAEKWYLQLKAVYYKQGLDSNNVNYGSNIFAPISTRPMNENWQVGEGNKATVLFTSGLLSYEVKENLFVDINGVYRNYKTINTAKANTWFVSAGIRWNMRFREFDF